jgi:CRISP-associated protein Cas1
MRPLLLTDYGLSIKTRDRKLVLWNQDTDKREEWIPRDFPYDSIIIEHLGGFVTFPALRWLSTNGISLTALDFNGSILGSWLPDYPVNARDRLAQYEAFTDERRRVSVARFVLEAKLGHAVPPVYQTVPDLLTYEARRAEAYWSDLGITRDYPNARDPTNAAINYASGLLLSRALLSCHRAGLEPSVGFLHEWRDHKPSLCLDLVEPFRASMVQVALKVRKGLNHRDFGEVFGHGLRLKPQAAHTLVTAFARTFSDRAMDAFTSRLTLRFATRPSLSAEGRAEPIRTEPRTEGRMVPRLSASVRAS